MSLIMLTDNLFRSSFHCDLIIEKILSTFALCPGMQHRYSTMIKNSENWSIDLQSEKKQVHLLWTKRSLQVSEATRDDKKSFSFMNWSMSLLSSNVIPFKAKNSTNSSILFHSGDLSNDKISNILNSCRFDVHMFTYWRASTYICFLCSLNITTLSSKPSSVSFRKSFRIFSGMKLVLIRSCKAFSTDSKMFNTSITQISFFFPFVSFFLGKLK